MTQHQQELTIRPITGPDELDLFNRLPYVLNDELGKLNLEGKAKGIYLLKVFGENDTVVRKLIVE